MLHDAAVVGCRVFKVGQTEVRHTFNFSVNFLLLLIDT